MGRNIGYLGSGQRLPGVPGEQAEATWEEGRGYLGRGQRLPGDMAEATSVERRGYLVRGEATWKEKEVT